MAVVEVERRKRRASQLVKSKDEVSQVSQTTIRDFKGHPALGQVHERLIGAVTCLGDKAFICGFTLNGSEACCARARGESPWHCTLHEVYPPIGRQAVRLL